MASLARSRLLLGFLLLAAGSVFLSRFRTVRGENPVPAPPTTLRLGLHMDEVLALLGPPLRKSRQIFSHRAREQWLYGPPRNLRIVFDCKRGQKPQVLRFGPATP